MSELTGAAYPVIDPAKCGADNDCVDLCEAGVFEASATPDPPIVAHPELCVEGCTLCVDICRMNAISLLREAAAGAEFAGAALAR